MPAAGAVVIPAAHSKETSKQACHPAQRPYRPASPRNVATTGAVVTERRMMEKRRVGHSRRWYSATQQESSSSMLWCVQPAKPCAAQHACKPAVLKERHACEVPPTFEAVAQYKLLLLRRRRKQAHMRRFVYCTAAGASKCRAGMHSQAGCCSTRRCSKGAACTVHQAGQLRRTSHTPQMVPSTRPRNMPRTPLCSPACRGLAARVGALLPPLPLPPPPLAAGSTAIAGAQPAAARML